MRWVGCTPKYYHPTKYGPQQARLAQVIEPEGISPMDSLGPCCFDVKDAVRVVFENLKVRITPRKPAAGGPDAVGGWYSGALPPHQV